MLHEMEMYGGLEVVLIPAPEPKHSGHMIRVASNQNPPWYRRFTGQFMTVYGKGKRARPNIIKRPRIVTALQRIMDGRPRWKNCERLIEFISRELKNEDYKRKQKPWKPGDWLPF
jgi:hypothetical protein